MTIETNAERLKSVKDRKEWGSLSERDFIFLMRQVEQLQELESRIKVAQDLIDIQGANGNWNYDAYMLGMYNGMVLIHSIYNDTKADLREVPDSFIRDLLLNKEVVKTDE